MLRISTGSLPTVDLHGEKIKKVSLKVKKVLKRFPSVSIIMRKRGTSFLLKNTDNNLVLQNFLSYDTDNTVQIYP